MYRLYLWLILFCAAAGFTTPGQAEELHLLNGTVLTGEVASPNDIGVVVKLDAGGFSDRIPWAKFSQDTLKLLAKNPKAGSFAEPYVEEVLEEKSKAKREAITIKQPPRPERPTGRVSLFAALNTPAGFLILLVFFAANIFAAFEIAIYRHQPVVMTCVISAVAPVVAPIIFLAMPTRAREEAYVEEGTVAEEELAPADTNGEKPGSATSRMKNKLTSMFKPAGGGLKVAAHAKPGASKAGPEPKMFRRGDTTFNRRFFETQFPGFFRIVPSEADKDMVIGIKSGKNNYVAKRISRISSNEVGLQLQSGGEVSVSFGDITEVQYRHKDA
ncbi:MAG: hypothetical protein HY043_11210 [Verrucomicrobia bacterium]|nr:hypothetical protein [Verrucomicrobiota bacterium]